MVVVVLIAIVAAIAIPRLSRGARGATDAALRADLAILRNALDYYAAEHGGAFPQPLWQGLINQTDAAGNVGSTPGVHIYGPYVRAKIGVPVGPNVGATNGLASLTSPPTVDESQTNKGWAYNRLTGEVVANTDDLDESGVAYNTY